MMEAPMDREEDGFILRISALLGYTQGHKDPTVKLAFRGQVCLIRTGEKNVAVILRRACPPKFFARISRGCTGQIPVLAEEDPHLGEQLLRIV
jgi:hypothetical protein